MRVLLTLFLGAAAMLAQTSGQRQPPPMNELKAAVGLDDAQIAQLRDIQRERAQAQRQNADQIREKQQALRETLESPGASAAAVGQLMLDIRHLRTLAREAGEPYRQRALALLRPEQKTKLQALEEALKLQPAIRQAAALNLLEPPDRAALGPLMNRRGAAARMMMRQRPPR